MRNNLFLLIFICCLTAFVSCQDEDFGVTTEEVAASAYANNFIKAYGPIAPEQDWGFKSTMLTGTRAGSESYIHYRFTYRNSGWDNMKSITAQDGNKWDMEVEIGSGIVKEDKEFAAANYQGHVQQPEKNYVNQYLINHPDEGDTSCGLDSYLIYDLGNLNKGPNVGHMDQLTFDDQHFQAYNNGSSNYDYYVTNTAINDPWYRDSECSKEIHNHYRFYYIPAGVGEDGYQFPGGLYLCFDYGGKQQNLFDNIYNDWVLKIQPGDMSRQSAARRVFCEDLGNTHDWDFNDVVYDYVQVTTNKAKIEIKAVCGTLPIYFTVNGSTVRPSYTQTGAGITSWAPSEEIHELLGGKPDRNNFYQQIEYGTPRDFWRWEGIIYTHYATEYYVECSDIMDLGIKRQTDTGEPWYCIPSQQTGKVPFMIACPVGTTPSPEDVNIKTTYPNFTKYPSNPYIIWW